MGKLQPSPAAESTGFACYRVTSEGRAAVGFDHPQLRSRHVADLLERITMCSGGMPEPQLRQFMPPASLGASINILLELGLIECK